MLQCYKNMALKKSFGKFFYFMVVCNFHFFFQNFFLLHLFCNIVTFHHHHTWARAHHPPSGLDLKQLVMQGGHLFANVIA